MQAGKVKLEFWMADRLDWTGSVPLVIEEGLADGDSLRSVLGRLAERICRFPEAVFDPETQSLSSEVTIVINNSVGNMPDGLETKLKAGDHILFLPILAGG